MQYSEPGDMRWRRHLAGLRPWAGGAAGDLPQGLDGDLRRAGKSGSAGVTLFLYRVIAV